MARISTNGASKSAIQDSSYTYAADVGSNDAYAIVVSPAPSSYTEGQRFFFKANTLNTGAASLNVNSLGAKTLKKNTDQDLATGDIEAGSIVEAMYDGTNFQVLSVSAVAAGVGTWTDTSTSTGTNKTLTSPVINTPTGIVKGDVGLGNVDNTSNATERAATATLTNKTLLSTTNVVEEITTIASSATPTPTGGSLRNFFTVTALAAAATFAAPSGTPENGNTLVIRVKDNATARTLAYNAIYRAIGVTLPTTTVISKTLYFGCKYNSADSKWDILAYGIEA